MINKLLKFIIYDEVYKVAEKSGHQIQAELYAQDLAKIYQQEKAKRLELEEASRLLEERNEELLKEKAQLKAYAKDFQTLYKQLQISYLKLNKANLETIYRLSIAAEYRDNDTAAHLQRMSEYSGIIAKNMGLKEDQVDMIKKASPMHDIGKIGITDSILLKPGKYTKEEFEEMKKHPYIGHLILKDSESKLLQTGEIIAYTHHEKWDGSGYPRGLKGTEIPVEGRIIPIADVYDALSTKRVYKPAFTQEKVMEIMKDGRGSHFDPDIFDIFMDSLEEIEDFRKSTL